MSDEKKTQPHSLILENRQNLHLTGITDVGEFDEQLIRTVTSMGGLLVRGKRLHISQLDLASGDLVIDGEIHALHYVEAVHKGKGAVARLFR